MVGDIDSGGALTMASKTGAAETQQSHEQEMSAMGVIEAGAIAGADAAQGSHDATGGQTGVGQTGTEQVGTEQVGTEQVGTEMVGAGHVAIAGPHIVDGLHEAPRPASRHGRRSPAKTGLDVITVTDVRQSVVLKI